MRLELNLVRPKLARAATVLSLALALFLIAAVPAAWASPLTTTLRVENLENTLMLQREVTVEYRPLASYGVTGMSDPGFITPLHVLAQAFEDLYGPGAAADRIGAFGILLTIDGSHGSVAGEPNVWWMWTANQSQPTDPVSGWGYASNEYPVQQGDAIDFLAMWGGQWGVHSPWMSFFDSTSYSVAPGQPLELTLNGLDGFDDFGDVPFTRMAGAEILKDVASAAPHGAVTPTGILTDAQGQASITFTEPGVYVLSATRIGALGSIDITRPFAVVTVSDEPPVQLPPAINPEIGSSHGDGHNSGTTGATTPGIEQSAQVRWSHRVSDGASALSPVKVGNYIYVAGGSTLYKFNTATQVNQLVATAALAAPVGPAGFLAAGGSGADGAGMIFVPLGAGQVQAFNADTLAALWTSEAFDSNWLSLGALSYRDGHVYGAAGFDLFMRQSEGSFFCLDAATGQRVWTYSSTSTSTQRGFYWSGAAHIDTTQGPALLFAGDDGIVVSHLAGTAGAADAGVRTAEAAAGVIDTLQLPGGVAAGVRSPVLFAPASGDAGGGIAYVATRGGQVARITVAADGSFVGTATTAALSGAGSTSTPVLYRDRLYVVSGELLSKGFVDVFNATTLQRLRSVQLPGFSQSSPLLSTAGATAANGYQVSLFVALNDARDDVVRIVDSETAAVPMVAQAIFRPGGSFTLSSVFADSAGTLYYTDGAGTFTALTASNNPLPDQTPGGGSGGGTGSSSGNSGGTGDVQSTDPGAGNGYDDSESATRTPATGPNTADDGNATRWLFIAAVSATIITMVISGKIQARKKRKLDALKAQMGTEDEPRKLVMKEDDDPKTAELKARLGVPVADMEPKEPEPEYNDTVTDHVHAAWDVSSEEIEKLTKKSDEGQQAWGKKKSY
ncbi:MAG: PQQ-binding-like beta-propeller repeat protein [Coriobacteriia bacterium]|nr:PQQ-binding-like beta-propeller repeat protein [Coriobacteriia bacterium]MCL2536829.1 PQQ-binding-like beta-propeller repeat protein [Coriobacteriia bacterium]